MRVLVIPDIQAPFEHPRFLSFLKSVYKKYRCNAVVCIGDEVDFHSISDYPHDPDGMSPGDELKDAIKHLRPYYKAFPRVLVCHSNHAARIESKALKLGLPRSAIKPLNTILDAPRTWIRSDRWEIDGVVYKHGLGYSGTLGAINSAKDEMKSCVIGHLHADAGILYWSNNKKTIFGMNVGCGIDVNAYAFAYGKHHRKKPVLSCGVVIDGSPYLELFK